MENRLRSFLPHNIIKIYEIYEEEGKLNDYWKYNVFIPLFKAEQYVFKPNDLYKIFRFMLILNHEVQSNIFRKMIDFITHFTKD